MSDRPNAEVQPKPSRRRFSVDYKCRIVAEATQCHHGELGALLRREGLYHSQLSSWRKAVANGSLGNTKRDPRANPNGTEVKRLRRENDRLQRKLADAESIIDAQKKLANLIDRLKSEDNK